MHHHFFLFVFGRTSSSWSADLSDGRELSPRMTARRSSGKQRCWCWNNKCHSNPASFLLTPLPPDDTFIPSVTVSWSKPAVIHKQNMFFPNSRAKLNVSYHRRPGIDWKEEISSFGVDNQWELTEKVAVLQTGHNKWGNWFGVLYTASWQNILVVKVDYFLFKWCHLCICEYVRCTHERFTKSSLSLLTLVLSPQVCLFCFTGVQQSPVGASIEVSYVQRWVGGSQCGEVENSLVIAAAWWCGAASPSPQEQGLSSLESILMQKHTERKLSYQRRSHFPTV